jgi:hypothetical protein
MDTPGDCSPSSKTAHSDASGRDEICFPVFNLLKFPYIHDSITGSHMPIVENTELLQLIPDVRPEGE